ncbi:hypothetical protein [Streptosporangium longisporum]|uniref:hypothetical protein n=1 Tax=Streptosporangium longisporum TaxID=46187 RepID=UPI0031E5CE44
MDAPRPRDPRSTLGPNATLKYEPSCVPGGLGTVGRRDGLVLGWSSPTSRASQSRADQLRVQRESGMDDAEWWLSNAPLLDGSWTPAAPGRLPRRWQAAGRPTRRSPTPPTPSSFGWSASWTGWPS